MRTSAIHPPQLQGRCLHHCHRATCLRLDLGIQILNVRTGQTILDCTMTALGSNRYTDPESQSRARILNRTMMAVVGMIGCRRLVACLRVRQVQIRRCSGTASLMTQNGAHRFTTRCSTSLGSPLTVRAAGISRSSLHNAIIQTRRPAGSHPSPRPFDLQAVTVHCRAVIRCRDVGPGPPPGLLLRLRPCRGPLRHRCPPVLRPPVAILHLPPAPARRSLRPAPGSCHPWSPAPHSPLPRVRTLGHAGPGKCARRAGGAMMGLSRSRHRDLNTWTLRTRTRLTITRS